VGGLSRGTRGWVLLDVVAALAVAVAGLAIVAGSVSTLARAAMREAARVREIIEERNGDALAR
jgi:hypothetical protein